jgi:hypothetical protein
VRHARNGSESGGERTPGPRGDGEARAWNRSAGAGAGSGGGGGSRGGEGRPGRRRSNQSQVWVLDAADKLRPVKVTTGIDDGALIEVSGEGLKPGDRVVVNQVDANGERRAAGGGNGPQGVRPPGSPTGFGGPGGGGPPGPRP